ncbi:MAG TPA: RICIN domain-containing protein [Catenuloplanes sp.]
MSKAILGKLAAFAAAVGVSVAVLVAPASPASAASYSFIGEYSNTCIDVPQGGTTVVNTQQCAIGSTAQDFSMVRNGGTTSQPIYILRNVARGTCLDVNGTLAFPAAKACNSASLDQRWERFTNSNGSKTFKSWGAWANRRAHVCLTNETQFDQGWLRKATCNAANARHQWDQY